MDLYLNMLSWLNSQHFLFVVVEVWILETYPPETDNPITWENARYTMLSEQEQNCED